MMGYNVHRESTHYTLLLMVATNLNNRKQSREQERESESECRTSLGGCYVHTFLLHAKESSLQLTAKLQQPPSSTLEAIEIDWWYCPVVVAPQTCVLRQCQDVQATVAVLLGWA
jgi:hypothetical protein